MPTQYAYQDVYEPEEGGYPPISFFDTATAGMSLAEAQQWKQDYLAIEFPTKTLSQLAPQTGGTFMLAKLTQLGYSSLKSNAIVAIANAAKTTGLAFANLPSWVKTGLTFVGIDSLIDWVVEEASVSAPPNSTDWIQEPDENPTAWTTGFAIAQIQRGQTMMATTPPPFRLGQPFQNGLTVLKSWIANGMVHLKLSNGYRAVQKLDGEWKIWRPKRIKAVLYSDGAKDLPSTLRAAKILKKQAKDMRKVVDFFYPTKTTKKVPANVINVETGSGALVSK